MSRVANPRRESQTLEPRINQQHLMRVTTGMHRPSRENKMNSCTAKSTRYPGKSLTGFAFPIVLRVNQNLQETN